MKSKFDQIYLVIIIVLLSGCSAYQEDDYGEPETNLHGNKKESVCVNMESDQEAKCRENEEKLVISLGADENCSHPFQYQKKHCINEKIKHNKQLNQSLEKHVK